MDSAPETCPVPDPTILDPSAANGRCPPPDQHPPKRASQGDPFNSDHDHQMKISDGVEGEGNNLITLTVINLTV